MSSNMNTEQLWSGPRGGIECTWESSASRLNFAITLDVPNFTAPLGAIESTAKPGGGAGTVSVSKQRLRIAHSSPENFRANDPWTNVASQRQSLLSRSEKYRLCKQRRRSQFQTRSIGFTPGCRAQIVQTKVVGVLFSPHVCANGHDDISRCR